MSRFAFLAALTMAAPALAQTQYFADIDDLPIPPGFGVEMAAGTAFTADGGRIVIVQGYGATAPETVRDFYLQSLPALGWSRSPGGEALVFLRGRERLTLEVTPARAGTHLRVELVERPTPAR